MLSELKGCLPAITWGHGHSPKLKDKCYATLAVAWGPLIQLFILNDILNKEGEIFIDDGYVILESEDLSEDEQKF